MKIFLFFLFCIFLTSCQRFEGRIEIQDAKNCMGGKEIVLVNPSTSKSFLLRWTYTCGWHSFTEETGEIVLMNDELEIGCVTQIRDGKTYQCSCEIINEDEYW